MKRQRQKAALLFLCLLATPARAVCVRAPLPVGAEAKGDRAGGGGWATVTAVIPVSVAAVVEDLRRHGSTRTDDIAELRLSPLPAEGRLERHDAHFTVKPFLFITIEWVERWVFTLQKGTAATPQEVLATYEKTEGTSHIKHLCGSISVKSRDAAHTEISLYEEADASQRSPADTLEGLKDTIQSLSKGKGT